MDSKEYKFKVIKSAKIAIEELLKVIEEEIISEEENTEDLSADKLKNAAATKKLAIFDAFEIIDRIDKEEAELNKDLNKTEKEVKKEEEDNEVDKKDFITVK